MCGLAFPSVCSSPCLMTGTAMRSALDTTVPPLHRVVPMANRGRVGVITGSVARGSMLPSLTAKDGGYAFSAVLSRNSAGGSTLVSTAAVASATNHVGQVPHYSFECVTYHRPPLSTTVHHRPPPLIGLHSLGHCHVRWQQHCHRGRHRHSGVIRHHVAHRWWTNAKQRCETGVGSISHAPPPSSPITATPAVPEFVA